MIQTATNDWQLSNGKGSIPVLFSRSERSYAEVDHHTYSQLEVIYHLVVRALVTKIPQKKNRIEYIFKGQQVFILAPSFFIANFFHSDNVLGFTDVKMIIIEQFYQKLIFSFVFQLPFNSFFRKFSYNNIPLALIFSTSTKSDPNPNHIKIYRLLVSTVNYIWIKFGLLSSQSTLTNFAGQLCSLQSFPTFLLFDNTVGDNDLLSDVILRIQRSSPSPSLFCFSFICGGGGVGVGSGASG